MSINRRTLLIGGGAGVGLALAWAVWPRHYPLNLTAAPSETVLNAFLKIGRDGRVMVAVPQAEMGQGVYTALPQILADELGADWRLVGVEPAPIHPAYVNTALIEDGVRGALPTWMQGIGNWVGREVGRRLNLQLTGGSSSIRSFEAPLRMAGATARTLLCMAAARRWGIDWQDCEVRDGQVVAGDRRLGLGALAEDAAGLTPPGNIAFRPDNDRRFYGRSLPRLDVPAKVDGTAQFGADIRLPDMVYASVRAGPHGSRLNGFAREAATGVPGLVAVIDEPAWLAAVAGDWWTANRALSLLKPVFAEGAGGDDATIASALTQARDEAARPVFSQGDIEAALAEGTPVTAEFGVPAVTHAPMETLTATARIDRDQVEIWVPTQSASLTRSAVARALDVPEGGVVVYPTLVGGGFGRKIEVDAAVQAAIIARRVKRPVQLVWSREEETAQGYARPPALARLKARLDPDKRIAAWDAVIAAPPATRAMLKRVVGWVPPGGGADPGAVEGAVPPYDIASVRIAHAAADMDLPWGIWRSVANSYTAFFTECFMDELATLAQVDPLSFRLRMLANRPRLAEVLKTAASLGGYAPGSGETAQGLAAHDCFGSSVAVLAEVAMNAGAVRVTRLVCAADCGRIVNPDIVRQQLEGGLIWGMAAALGDGLHWRQGLPTARNFDALDLPRLADTPEIELHLMPSAESPGGVGEIAVPPVAPAIANAVFAATGRRVRHLPINRES